MAVVGGRANLPKSALVIGQVSPMLKSRVYLLKDYPSLSLVLTYSVVASPVFRDHARGLRDFLVYVLALCFSAGRGQSKIFIAKMRSYMAKALIRAACLTGGASAPALIAM